MMGESGVSGEEVSGFLDSLYCLCKWTPECNIMALILIIRLFQVPIVPGHFGILTSVPVLG